MFPLKELIVAKGSTTPAVFMTTGTQAEAPGLSVAEEKAVAVPRKSSYP